MRIAVVILNWNGKDFLEKFLPSVVQHSELANIYVADNASSDDSVAFITKHFPNVNLIENKENFGFAGGYNEALKGLKEEFYVLLNSDVEVTENWLEPMLRLLDSDRTIAACQPKVLKFDLKTHFEYAGAAGGFVDKYGFPFCRGRIFDAIEQDDRQYDSVKEVFWATGACMFVRRECYNELGGLDADFFAHMEEIDLCWRAKRAGFKVMVQPGSVVYHVGGGTLSQSNPWKTFLNFRNGLELLAKNLPSSALFQTLFVRMLFDGVAAMNFLVSGKPKDFLAVIHAHFAFYRRLRKTLSKRSGHYETKALLYNGSIVVDYFIRGKKRFTDLDQDRFGVR